jgi:aspartyl-tRNA(Asn)/glutamyl-tRNA(Gln) amidotransferase subunit A
MATNLDLNGLTVSSSRSAVQERQLTAIALVEAFYRKIEDEDRQPGQVNAYLTLSRERALQQAAKIDAVADRGDPLPPLGGVPVAVKDVIATRGVRNTALRLHRDFSLGRCGSNHLGKSEL